MWIKQIKPSKLGFILFLKVLVAGAACMSLYLVLLYGVTNYVDRINIKKETYTELINTTAQEFQDYITENRISIHKIDAIRYWDKKQNLLYIRLVENNRIIYDSLDYISKYSPKIAAIYYESAKDSFNLIHFTDGRAVMYIGILYKQRLEQQFDYIIGSFCILLFCFCILKIFKRIVCDIVKIEKGIQILESGDLTYHIETMRNDEISELADSINRMSKELECQKLKEEALRQKNYDLVTSISHDIRTPLTTVNSYIDLILEKKYSDTEEMERYLAKIKEKSNLIKDLTDNLFNHFINQSKDYQMNFEVVIGNEFITYIFKCLEEGLRDRGCLIEARVEINDEFYLNIDTMQILRVFNNIEGNLLKYASKNKLILYTAKLENRNLIITGINYFQENRTIDSHGVGMNNCKEIVTLHSGILTGKAEDDLFVVTISLPLYDIHGGEKKGL